MDHSIITHNGEITIHNPNTGNHRTFRIRTQPNDANFAPGKRIISLLTGNDNEGSYTGFGFVQPSGVVTVWRKRRGGVYDQYARMIASPAAYEEKHGLTFLFATRCRVCNRKLTTPRSIEVGIGPVCEGRG